MLSNTATPKYYGKFRDAVIRGDILVTRTKGHTVVVVQQSNQQAVEDVVYLEVVD